MQKCEVSKRGGRENKIRGKNEGNKKLCFYQIELRVIILQKDSDWAIWPQKEKNVKNKK